jgi:predicted MPP superfamily phosphohydrolase
MAVPKPRQIEVAIEGLPAAFEGYRVLQLTDIHASRLLTGPGWRRWSPKAMPLIRTW